MADIGQVRFEGRAKWSAVAANLAIAALGVFLVVVVWVAVPADVHAIRALGWYTAFATALTVALAVALARTRQLPTVRRTEIDGAAAGGVEAWPWEWRYNVVLDLALAAAAATVAVIGITAGDGWLIPSLLVAAGGAWFLVRAALSVTGRRRNEALWITAEQLVHDTVNGRERVDRREVTAVRPVGHFVIADLGAAGTGRLPPLLWRRKRRLGNPRTIVFDTQMVGHTPDQLASWLRDQLGIDEHGRPTRTPPPSRGAA
jgi:hypothetical protein